MTSQQMIDIHGMIHDALTPCIANLDAVAARLRASSVRLVAKLEMLHQLRYKERLRTAMASERGTLRSGNRVKANERLELETGEVSELAEPRTVCTEDLRRDYLERDVDCLIKLVAMPYFIAEGSAEAA